MRRNNRNPGRIGGGGSSLNTGGPFLSDHLKDIDLELDLLKRKREMLERQQMIQPLMPPQRTFNEPPFYQLESKESGSNRDFSHLYNDGSQHRKPYSKKRQSDSDWQQNSYPKRSSGQGQRSSYGNAGSGSVRNQRPYSAQNQQSKSSTPYNYGHNKQSIGQRLTNQRPPPQRSARPVVANKVTKPTKAHAPPNKLAAQPVTDRQKLVATAIQSVAEVVTRDREALRLLPDKIPTKQMTGRLELALGAILKDIREKCAETAHSELLRSTSLQRVIKQAIRERIRSAMLGKVVGTTPDTIKEYRAMYPKDTDIEIVNIALEAGGVKPQTDRKPIAAKATENENPERPEDFYKVKMIKLIDKHLHEMFDKVRDIYHKEAEEARAAEFTEDIKTETTQEENKEASGAQPAAVTEENVTPQETSTSAEAAEGAGGDAANTEPVNGDSVEAGKTAAAVSNDDELNVEHLPHADDYKRLLPRLLKRHIPTILKLLHINRMYKRAVFDINSTTRSKLVDYGRPEEFSGPVSADNTETTPKKFPPPYVVLPYYVKVMGKPQLPKKKVMHTFLEVFHPRSIKKHRTIHNLLFIGFSEKSDFDAIVEADGTIIGRSTLSIRICDKTPGRPDDKGDTATDQNTSQNDAPNDDSKNDSANDLIGTDLEGQISDLLTTVDKDQANTSIDADDQQMESTEAQEEIPGEGDQDFTAEDNGETVDNVDEVLDNIEEQIYDDNTEQNGDSEAVANDGESQETPETQPAGEQADQVTELKNTTAAKGTPSRASARLSTPATPSSIRTRRSSRQIQN